MYHHAYGRCAAQQRREWGRKGSRGGERFFFGRHRCAPFLPHCLDSASFVFLGRGPAYKRAKSGAKTGKKELLPDVLGTIGKASVDRQSSLWRSSPTWQPVSLFGTSSALGPFIDGSTTDAKKKTTIERNKVVSNSRNCFLKRNERITTAPNRSIAPKKTPTMTTAIHEWKHES